MNYRWILPPAFCLLTCLAQADIAESTVPIPAVMSVKAAYPAAARIEWDYDGERNQYEAEFRLQGFEYEVFVNAEGKIVLVKAEIAPAALPPAVSATVHQRYPEGRIEKVKKITHNECVRYKVEVRDARGEVDIYVDPRGNILHEKH